MIGYRRCSANNCRIGDKGHDLQPTFYEPMHQGKNHLNYLTRIVTSLAEVGQQSWDELVAAQPEVNPFLSYGFLHALHESGSAAAASGWEPHYLTVWQNNRLDAAVPLYLKHHSYGEYVFDWAWADAYRRHGLEYYPKLLSSIPFTPVTGSRLISRNAEAASILLQTLVDFQTSAGLSSTHVLYLPEHEAALLGRNDFLLRSNVQFHWLNNGYQSFDDFLDTLDRKKRKNIRAERRKVAEAGIRFRRVAGSEATVDDWRFFVRCYNRTYATHYSTPYLNLDFFLRIGAAIPDNILLVIAEREGTSIASSLLIHTDTVLYGRYWGAVTEVPCLHFETAYYQPLEFCIARQISRFEGGAQGEHKMARGFLPHKTWSAHWLAHPAFADAVEQFLARESNGIDAYIDELNDHTPYR